jgi:putative ATP-dependent endonuclease of OLD family
VLEPIKRRFDALMQDDHSDLRARIKELQAEASKPMESFKESLETVQKRVNSSYRRVFQTSEIRLSISLGELGVDPSAALSKSSHVEIVEGGAQSKWQQQGTGSQRALFWSMLEVRSELSRLEEQRKAAQKALADKQKELKKLKEKPPKKAAAIPQHEANVATLEAEIESLKGGSGVPEAEAPFLPGYMLLIDEPETALHPSAIRAAKEHLYSLAAASGWQVMLSTHHPIFVDPLKDHTTIVRLQREGSHTPPNVYRADSMSFEGDEKENLKSLLAFDPSVAEMFFGPKVVVMEGDTEFAAFSEVMNSDLVAYPMEARPLLLRARGKATIPILLKMLTHFKVNFAVLHDIDPPRTANGAKKNGAYSTNQSISDAVKAARAVGLHAIHRSSCPNFEQHHGMALPDKDKPYQTWKEVRENAEVKESVRKILEELCAVPMPESGDHPDDGGHFENKLRSWIDEKKIDDAAYAFQD